MADLGFWEIVGLISQRFPQYLPILSQPGVFQVLADAINQQWTPDRIFTALQDTEYFRSTTDAQRAWDILAATNPATAGQKAAEADRMVRIALGNLGVQLDGADQFRIVVQAAQNGWDQNRIMAEIGYYAHPAGPATGMVANKMAELQGIAEKYGVNLPQDAYWKYAVNIASGVQPQDLFQSDMMMHAMNLYPILSGYFAQGHTLEDYAQPYLALLQQETGGNPANFDLRNPNITALFIGQDDKGNQIPITQQQALAKIRTDPVYQYNQGLPGRQAATNLATGLLQKMGALG